MAFQGSAIRSQFPILSRKVQTLAGARSLVYLDHASSTHAPRPVLDAVRDLLENDYANIHRGNHTLSQRSSDLFDHSVETLMRFVGAHPETQCAVMGQNTTMALDLAAHLAANPPARPPTSPAGSARTPLRSVRSAVRPAVRSPARSPPSSTARPAQRPGVTLTTFMEHHSNDLPHRRRGEVLHAEVDAEGRLLLDDLENKLQSHQVRLVALSGASNVTGVLPPIAKVARMAHDHSALCLVDAAQLYAHRAIDMKPVGHPEHIDMLAAAGHKSYAPLGSAFLIADRELMDAAPPHMPGGGTVDWVGDDEAGFTTAPARHMGGTPNVAGAVAFAAATTFLAATGMESVERHEAALTRAALKRFAELEQHGVRLLGPRSAQARLGVFSFVVPTARHELVSAILDREHAVATRNGCFCAHPLLTRLLGTPGFKESRRQVAAGEKAGVPGATRASLGIYNTHDDLDRLFEGIEAVAKARWQGRYDIDGHGVCRLREGGRAAGATDTPPSRALPRVRGLTSGDAT